MKKGWPIKCLAEVAAKITDGSHNPPTGIAHSDYLMLSSKNVFDDDFHYEAPRYLTAEQFHQENKRTGISAGDVLLTIVGTIGRSAVVPEDAPNLTLQRSVAVIRPRRDIIEPRFLMYSFIHRSVELKDQARGVAQKGIYLEALRELDVAVPPLLEQQRIIGLLDKASKGIATAKANAEQNLENARALFGSQLQSVFTQRDEGWVNTTVGELVGQGILEAPLDGNHGEIHPKKADFVTSGVPFIMASDLHDGIVDQENCTFISEKQAASLRKGFAKDGDVLLSHKGTIGRVAILHTRRPYVILTPQVTYYRIADKNSLLNRFLYYIFQAPEFVGEIREIAGAGSTRAYIGITRQRDLPIFFPSPGTQKTIAVQLDALFSETQELASVYERKVEALDALKKSLLHEAFSGNL